MAEITDKISAGRSAFAEQQASVADFYASVCESPIESALFWWLLSTPRFTRGWWPALHGPTALGVPGCGPDWIGGLTLGNEPITLWPQLPVATSEGRYILDFALVHDGRLKSSDASVYLAIECDGHDFHEKTKAQAIYDKRRDRELQAIGWQVARFTGAEIFADPEGSAESVWKMFADLVWRAAEKASEPLTVGTGAGTDALGR